MAETSKTPDSVTFMDGFTVTVGDVVRFTNAAGGGTGTVTRIMRHRHSAPTVCIDPHPGATFGPLDRWMLNPEAAKEHGHPDFINCRDHGVPGGAIVRPTQVQ